MSGGFEIDKFDETDEFDTWELWKKTEEYVHILRGMTEDGETAVISLFQESPADDKGVFLIDVYVHPDYRGEDAVHRCLQQAEKYFLKRGKEYLQVRCCGKKEKLESLYHFLVQEAFIPVSVSGGMMRYRLYNWFRSDFMKKKQQMEEYIQNVQTIEDWEDERLQAFLRTGVRLPRECFDPQFCRFYVVDGQIQAALCAERLNDKMLFFHQLVFTPKCLKQIAFLAMLASLICQAEKHKMEDYAVLVVQSHLQSLLKGMREQFGMPEMEYLYQEYLYPFGRKKADKQAEGVQFAWSMEAAEIQPTELKERFLYEGIDDAVFTCMRSPSGMILSTAGLTRWGENGAVDSPEWRKELNAWWELIGRETIEPKKPLPFDMYAEQKKPIQVGLGKAKKEIQKVQGEQPKELQYAVLSRNMESFVQVLPAYLQERCVAGELVIVAGSDEAGSVLSYAVFSHLDFPERTMLFEYIYVAEQYRGCGLGEKVFAHAKQAFQKATMKGITARQVTAAVQAEGLHRFLKQLGFQPVSLSVSVIAYYLQDLYEAAVMQIPKSLIQKMPKMESIPEPNDIRLRNLANESQKQGYAYSFSRYDSRFSRFHIKGGKICAAMFMEQPAENVLMYQGIWFARGYDSPQMRATLLVSVLEEAKASLREDALLIFQFDPSWEMSTIEKLLGDGEVTLRMYEYALSLQSDISE